MKQIIVVPFILLAILSVVLVSRPSTAQSLQSDFPAIKDSITSAMPKVGTRISLPRVDTFGRAIDSKGVIAIVAMPSCQSCTAKRINWNTLKNLTTAPVILVFPEALTSGYPEVSSSRFRVITEGKSHIFRPELHEFGPSCVWVDKNGAVLRAMPTFALDGAISKAKR